MDFEKYSQQEKNKPVLLRFWILTGGAVVLVRVLGRVGFGNILGAFADAVFDCTPPPSTAFLHKKSQHLSNEKQALNER